MKKIIIISGKQYSGKDTVASILLKKLENYKRIGIGDAIKIEYGSRNNLSFEEIEKNKHLYRGDLIELGNWGRAKDPDFWLYKLADLDRIIVPDIRVEHEIDFFRKRGAFLIRVESDYKNRALRGILANSDDLTEVGLDNYKNWDLVIENNSTYEDLVQQVNGIIEKFLA